MSARSSNALPLRTLDDLLAIPEEQRWHELIEGALYEKGAATGAHGSAQHSLSVFTGPFDRRPRGQSPGGWWLGTNVDTTFDDRNTFRPDIAGWRRETVAERPTGSPVRVRPDWICEILSTNRANDLVKKKRVYHRHQVPHDWIVDPLEASLSVCRYSPEGYVEVLLAERGEKVFAEPFEAMPLFVGMLFGDEEEEPSEPR